MLKFRHYLGLFIVISLGVAAGNLLSNYATSQYLMYQAQKALTGLKAPDPRPSIQSRPEQKSSGASSAWTIPNEDSIPADITDDYQVVESQTGVRSVTAPSDNRMGRADLNKPSRDCLDWLRAHKQFRTETSDREVRRACEGFEELIEE